MEVLHLQRVECSNTIEIRNGIMFDFYLGLLPYTVLAGIVTLVEAAATFCCRVALSCLNLDLHSSQQPDGLYSQKLDSPVLVLRSV